MLPDRDLDQLTPRNWRDLDATAAAGLWPVLAGWIGWLRDRYGLDVRVVPPCWYLHGAVVDLLTALHDHHRGAYDGLALTGPIEWQRSLRDAEPRLRDWVARSGCTAAEHRPDHITVWLADEDRWRRHVGADLASRTES